MDKLEGRKHMKSSTAVQCYSSKKIIDTLRRFRTAGKVLAGHIKKIGLFCEFSKMSKQSHQQKLNTKFLGNILKNVKSESNDRKYTRQG